MIPKIIHYCWLSGTPLPDDIKTYIEGWKKLMPDYKLIEWNRSRFDINSAPFVKQACEIQKWAFAADYIRVYALYNYGGIYLDSDVEVLKKFDDFLQLTMMLGYENTNINSLEVAVWGSEKGHPLLKDILDELDKRQFVKADGSLDTKPLPIVVRDLIKNKGYKCIDVKDICDCNKYCNEIPLFPYYYFSPKSHATNQTMMTDKSYCIHHFKASWLSSQARKRMAFIAYIKRTVPFIVKIINCIRKLTGRKTLIDISKADT